MPKGPTLVLLVVIAVVLGGTAGYMAIEGWNAWDAFYMTVITITTVGYREVHDLSFSGQLLRSFCLSSALVRRCMRSVFQPRSSPRAGYRRDSENGGSRVC